MIGDGVVARTGCDHVEAAGTVNRVGARAAGDDIGRSGTGDGNSRCNRGGIDILEIRGRDGITNGLIGGGEIDRGGSLQDKRIIASTAVDRDFCSPVIDSVISRTCSDDVRTSTTVDNVGAGASGNGISRGRTGDDQPLGCAENAGVDVLEIRSAGCIANGLVDPRRHAEIDACDTARRLQDERVGTGAAVDRDFCAVVGDRVVARPCIDNIGAAAAINRIGARTANKRVRRRVARKGNTLNRCKR